MEKCKVCDTEASVVEGDVYFVDCPRCSQYNIRSEDYTALDTSHKLSSMIRESFQENNNIVLVDDSLLVKSYSAEDKSIEEKYHLFLIFIFNEVKYAGLEIGDESLTLMATSWIEDPEELNILIDEALNQNHLKYYGEDTEDVFKFTYQGIKYLEVKHLIYKK